MTIKLQGSSSGHVNLDAKATAANNTITLPDTANGEVLAIDSSNKLSKDTLILEKATGHAELTVHAAENNSGSNALVTLETSNDFAESGIVFKDSSGEGGSIRYNHGDNDIRILTDGTTEQCRFTSDGLKLTAGNGISFSAYAAGNLLDDYEEGSWTPQAQYWNGSAYVANTHAAGSPGHSTGYYIKIGNLVQLSWYSGVFRVTDGHGSNAAIGNLPFAAMGGQQGYQVGSTAHATCFVEANQGGYTSAGAARFQFIREDSTYMNTWKDTSVSAEYLMFSVVYRIA